VNFVDSYYKVSNSKIFQWHSMIYASRKPQTLNLLASGGGGTSLLWS